MIRSRLGRAADGTPSRQARRSRRAGRGNGHTCGLVCNQRAGLSERIQLGHHVALDAGYRTGIAFAGSNRSGSPGKQANGVLSVRHP